MAVEANRALSSGGAFQIRTQPGSATVNRLNYHYQDRGLLAGIDYRLGGTAEDLTAGQPLSVSFDYGGGAAQDIPWRLHTVHYPDNGGGEFAVQYEYDPSGAVRSVHSSDAPGSDGFINYWQLLDTDQGFRPKQELFGNGVQTDRAYFSLADSGANCQTPNTSCIPGLLRQITTTNCAEFRRHGPSAR